MLPCWQGELDKEGIHVPGSLAYKDIRPVVDFVMHASNGLLKVFDNAMTIGQPLGIFTDSSKLKLAFFFHFCIVVLKHTFI
jgi:hypothetical protein